ncbi:MAG: efflux RND transporter periplasmic adaptor subunit [Nitrospirota bacterium]|nr:efflux RND transporter periplasmic adaptor subunit [Nitrospirota bacterium]
MPSQIRWVSLVLGIFALVGGGWWLYGMGWQLPVAISEALQPNTPVDTDMPGMKMKDMPTHTDAQPSIAMVSPVQQELIGMQTAVVEKRQLSITVRAVGEVTYNEQRINHVNLRISGWIEELFLDFTGQAVQEGQPLFTLYSPELLATQEEYVLALEAFDHVQQSPLPHVHQQAEQVIDAARDRLRLWTFTEEQIDQLTKTRKPMKAVTIYSSMSGYVIDKTAFQGMFVEPNNTLYTIADLSTIWVQAEVYEYELSFIQLGQPASLQLEAFPGETFSGEVSYIYPYLNKKSRTAKIRIEFSNPDIRLKPDMYGTVLIEVERSPSIAVPAEAVLDSGRRQIVFVAHDQGMFETREVTLGPKVGSYYEVTHGLNEGERIVTSGTFLLDSESQLMTSGNMMGALGMGGVKMEQAQMGKMDMGDMDMSGMNKNMDKKMNMKGKKKMDMKMKMENN